MGLWGLVHSFTHHIFKLQLQLHTPAYLIIHHFSTIQGFRRLGRDLSGKKTMGKKNKGSDDEEEDYCDPAGQWRLEYDFYSAQQGGYIFPESTAHMLIDIPEGGTGVITVKYCFAGDNSNDMLMVQTGFFNEDEDKVPVKIAKVETDMNVEDLYNEYSFTGEFRCGDGDNGASMALAFHSHFEGNAYLAFATRETDVTLDAGGCPIV